MLMGVVALACAAPASAQQTSRCDGGSPVVAGVTPAPDVGAQKHVELVSKRDGVAIDVAYFLPAGLQPGQRVPVIVNATPYHHAQDTLDLHACKGYFIDNFVPHGYAMAFVAVRGTGGSGGCMDLFGPGERDDLDQAVTWLATQPWSTGNVGMIGKSYEGATQWEVAAKGNPHLKTIVPIAGVPDVFTLMYEGGNIDFRGPLALNDLYYAPSVVTYADGRPVERTVEVTACLDYAIGNLAAAESSVTGLPDSFGYWDARRFRQEIERNYRGSIFLVQGFLDLNVPPDNQYPWIEWARRAGLPLKQMWGQWQHVRPDQSGRKDWDAIVLAWMDRWLKDDRSAKTGPAVEVQDSLGRWRSADRWPPQHADTKLYLGASGALSAAPDSGSATHVLAPDPVHVQPGTLSAVPTPIDASCPVPSCTAFTLAATTGELKFAGRPRLHLRVTPVADAGHVSAYLYAVDAGGAAERIGWGQADVRFPDADGRRKTAAPGEPMDLTLDFEPLESVVPAGSTMVLVVSEGAAYDRIPSIPTAPLTLETGGDASWLQITPVQP
jgi:putative CocE/NonD family hydrolase